MKSKSILFTSECHSGFSSAVKQRVNAYFSDNNLSIKANGHMVLKSVFYLGGLGLLYLLILSGAFGGWALPGLNMLLGFFLAGIGINIGHDACHGACSSNPVINSLVGKSFELIGASTYNWKVSHNIIHHTYTRIVNWDGDLESMPLLRFYVKPGIKGFHRYQHWYATFLYGFISLVWVFSKDYKEIFGKRNRKYAGTPPLSAYVSLIGFKLLHYLLFLIVPFFVLPLPFWQILLGFFVMHYVAGLTLTTLFQIGHCVEGTDLVLPDDENKIHDAWLAHQLKTSANFWTGRPLSNWICGGLQYQIEHHLFPKICHVHYPAIAPIVQKTAKEYGLPYHHFESFIKGYSAHLKSLKKIGRTSVAG